MCIATIRDEGHATQQHPRDGLALRSGAWKRLGHFDLHQRLLKPRDRVQWPVFTLKVTVWSTDGNYDTTVDDPQIQDLEIIAAWDAVHHIPERLTADFGEEQPEWYVGGPVKRQCRMKEEFARRFPDALNHQLPLGWIPTSTH